VAEPFWTSEQGDQTQLIDILDSSLWDTAILGGRRLPGVVRVEAEPGRKIDVTTSPGTDGASIIDKGFDPSKPQITCLIWTPHHWAQMQEIIAAFVPRPGKSPAKPPPALGLTHPGANALGITGVLILSVTTPKPGPVKGSFEVTFKCVQWVKPKPAIVGTPQLNIATQGAVEPAAGPAPASPSSTNFKNP
jgi:hypothetical protein